MTNEENTDAVVRTVEADVTVSVGQRETAPSKYETYTTPRWKAELTENQSDNLKEDYLKLLDGRKDKDAEKKLAETIIKRMGYRSFKAEQFDITEVLFEKSLRSIMQAWKEHKGVDDYKPSQKKLDENDDE